MAWRFRTSFAPIPGVRVTLSGGGISTSVGVGPARLTAGPTGVALTAGLTGTGLSFTQRLSPGPARPQAAPSVPARPPAPRSPAQPNPPGAGTPVTAANAGMRDIKSAGSSALTSPGLAAFKATLDSAQRQSAEIERDLGAARPRASKDARRCQSWTEGWLFRRLMKQRFAAIQARAEESGALRAELEEQLAQSRLDAQFQMPDGVERAFSRLLDDFDACRRSQRIWDNVAHRATNRVAERTVAGRVVDLRPVKFDAGQCGVIRAPTPIPRLGNANGGDLHLFPGFVVYMASADNYALIELADIELRVERMRFHEEGPVPGDAAQVGTTYAKANKDGTPDKRFKDNHAIPVMQYARITLRSAAGLDEEYVLSDVGAAEAFGRSWSELRGAVAAGV